MKKVINQIASALAAVVLLASCSSVYDINTDVLIIGGGASGVSAGIQASRMGVNSVIVEETTWLGGMLTAAGVSCIDGNRRMPSGFFGEFRDSLAAYYGGDANMNTNWVSSYSFEPSVANALLQRMAARESEHLTVLFESKLVEVKKINDGWVAIVENSKGEETLIHARILIDGTEFGDVAKAVGVGYDLGMENGRLTGEDIAPDSAYNIVQDMTMVAILKDYGEGADMTIDRPEGYDSLTFRCTCINDLCDTPRNPKQYHSLDHMMTYGKLQNGKYMINWPNYGNDFYANIVDMTQEERDSVLNVARNHTLQYVYFLQTQLGLKNLGLADDEFPTPDKLAFIPYVRESRRIHGLVRFKVNDIAKPFDQETALYRTGIAVGDYPVDHHHSSYNGPENFPMLYFYGIPSYCLPMGTLIPQDVDDMIVTEKSISVSNIANGTTRLQPMTVQIGQVAGVLAALAVKNNCDIKDIPVRDVQNILLEGGGYIMPYLDVTKNDVRFKPYQRVGATGILKGEGRNVNWSNETWFRADTTLLTTELDGLTELYPQAASLLPEGENLTIDQAAALIATLAGVESVDAQSILAGAGFPEYDGSRAILRGEFAVLVDAVLDPFNAFDVDINGYIVEKGK